MTNLDNDIKDVLKTVGENLQIPVFNFDEIMVKRQHSYSNYRRVMIAAIILGIGVVLSATAPTLAERFTGIGAKNQPSEVKKALHELQNASPTLYEFKGLEDRLKLTLVSDEPQYGPGNLLYYRVPEADFTDSHQNTIQGFLFVKEYKKNLLGKANAGINSDFESNVFNGRIFAPEFDKNKPTNTFVRNGIHWNYYYKKITNSNLTSKTTLLGEKDDMYYEIDTQGNYDYRELFDFIQQFEPSTKQ